MTFSKQEPKRWRDRAEEIRVVAEGMRDSDQRQSMVKIAAADDAMVDRAERIAEFERRWRANASLSE
jgi:hypothetical protein